MSYLNYHKDALSWTCFPNSQLNYLSSRDSSFLHANRFTMSSKNKGCCFPLNSLYICCLHPKPIPSWIRVPIGKLLRLVSPRWLRSILQYELYFHAIGSEILIFFNVLNSYFVDFIFKLDEKELHILYGCQMGGLGWT